MAAVEATVMKHGGPGMFAAAVISAVGETLCCTSFSL